MSQGLRGGLGGASLSWRGLPQGWSDGGQRISGDGVKVVQAASPSHAPGGGSDPDIARYSWAIITFLDRQQA